MKGFKSLKVFYVGVFLGAGTAITVYEIENEHIALLLCIAIAVISAILEFHIEESEE